MKKISMLGLALLAACQQASSSSAVNIADITVLESPASEAAQGVDISSLPEGFPLLAEMKISQTPKYCGLSKSMSARKSLRACKLRQARI